MNIKQKLFLLSFFFFNNYIISIDSPHLTVVFVVDQLGYFYFPKLLPFLTGGFKTLFTQGIVYNDAHKPHWMPATAPGHAALSTGTYPDIHGIVGNHWYSHGKKIKADQDDRPESAVFNADELYNYGLSSKNLFTDTLSDQFVLANPKNHAVWAFSYKSRAAIFLAGKLGKAIWFDSQTGNFTSSKAYFTQLPLWIKSFNQSLEWQELKNNVWSLQFAQTADAYTSVSPLTYCYTEHPTLINTSPKTDPRQEETIYERFMYTPQANQLLLDLAYDCIQQNNAQTKKIVWISLSSLDKVGHDYGPASYEVIDMLFKLDKQLDAFMRQLNNKYNNNILYVLASDHGVSPIPEIMQELGYQSAQRLNSHNFIQELNQKIAKKFEMSDAIIHSHGPFIYINPTIEKDNKKKKSIYSFIKTELEKIDGIQQVWDSKQLQADASPSTLEYFLKRQLFPNRSGQLMYKTAPYFMVSRWDTGTGHRSPYNYDTHVPLIIYRANNPTPQQVHQRVLTLQLAPSLSYLLNIARPSAAISSLLPGIVQSE